MKNYLKFISLYILLMIISNVVFAQKTHLDKFPKEKRDSILIAKAKAAILKYGPDFYNEKQTPQISQEIITEESIMYLKEEFYLKERKNIGRKRYTIIYSSDSSPDIASVFIWEDTGEVSNVSFMPKSGIGLGFQYLDEDYPQEGDNHEMFYKAERGITRVTTKKEYEKMRKNK